MSSSLVFEKSMVFALAILKVAQSLSDQHYYPLSDQVIRSGTGIGANISEALEAQSRKDFIHKMSIALKEASETKYWLLILRESDLLSEEYHYLNNDVDEIYFMLTSIVKTSKSK